MIDTDYLVFYSIGGGSWGATYRLIERGVSPDRITLLFADTKMEDEDTYRLLDDPKTHMGCNLVRIADGRDVWQVFADVKFIGNSRVDPCSKILKRQLMSAWRNENCDPSKVTLVYGLDWSERHRIDGISGKLGLRQRVALEGWSCEFPLNDRPYLTKDEIYAQMRSLGIEPPRLYKLGFSHNNCGGFCVKAGLGHFKHLLRTLPDRYLYHERREQEVADLIGGSPKPFIRLRTGGETRYLTMRQFRELQELQPTLFDSFTDQGWSCGGSCAVDDNEGAGDDVSED